MKTHYETELKKKIVHLNLEEGRTLASLTEEYNISRASITNWIREIN